LLRRLALLLLLLLLLWQQLLWLQQLLLWLRVMLLLGQGRPDRDVCDRKDVTQGRVDVARWHGRRHGDVALLLLLRRWRLLWGRRLLRRRGCRSRWTLLAHE